MTREINPFGLRMPPKLKQTLEEEAKRNMRSLNAELVARLEESVAQQFDESRNNQDVKELTYQVKMLLQKLEG